MPQFFVDPGDISKCLILVFDQSWGQRRIRGFPPFFFFFFFLFAFSVCFQEFEVALQNILALPSRDLTWCDINGEPLGLAPPCHLSLWSAILPSQTWHSCVLETRTHSAQATCINVDFWENLIFSTGHSCSKVCLLQIIREEVKVYDFFRHFKGNFKGRRYDSAVPPVCVFPNSLSCRQFCDFIDSTVLDWVSQAVIKVHGAVGVCSPPHLVLPLTVEPTKPRLCHDERFLNLWTRDLPFKLDHLPDLPRCVLPGHFQTTFDDKNGYQHLCAFFGCTCIAVYQ